MNEKRIDLFDLRFIVALFIIIFGVLLLLRNIGYEPGIQLWDYWPILLLLLGMKFIIRPYGNRHVFTGLLFMVAGLILLLSNLDIFDLSWRNIWPLIIILIGAVILYGAVWKPGKRSVGSDHLNLSAILGGGEYKFDTAEFKGGSITAILGGGTLDLRKAEISGDEAIIDAFMLMGGFELMIPHHWQVVLHNVPILGGVSDSTLTSPDRARAQNAKRLIIRGTTIMGGLEIKN